MKKKVLIISDGVGLGGAYMIPNDIHKALTMSPDFESIYAYGYGKRGLPEKGLPSNFKHTSHYLGPHVNALLFKITGKNIFPSNHKKLNSLIKWADVINIHNIHTYGFQYSQLVKLINEAQKKVVFTAHDDWIYTGRCAFRKECEKWKDGCLKCPHLDYYHAVWIDNAKKEYGKKIKAFNSIDQVTFTAPSQFIIDSIKHTYPSKKGIVIPNGIEVGFSNQKFEISKQKIKCLIIANNFINNLKVDYSFIETLIAKKNKHIELHFIGKNCPYKGDGIVDHGFITSKERMADIMQSVDIMLFFSKIDSFGLTLAEALCSGIHICAYESRASNEVLDGFDWSLITPKVEDFLSLIEDQPFRAKLKNRAHKETQSSLAIGKYSKAEMLNKFIKLLKS